MVGARRHQPAGRGDGHAISSGSAARCGWAIRWSAIAHAGRPRDRGRDRAAAGASAFDAVASNADIVHTYRDLLGRPRARPAQARSLAQEALQPQPVRRPFRGRGHLAGHPAPHDPVRPALQGPARRHLRARRAAAGFLDLPAPPDRHRSVDGAARARARSTRWSRWRTWASCRSTGTQVGPLLEKRILDEVGRRLIPDIHDRIVTKFHYAPSDFAHRPQRAPRQRLQPRADPDPERLVPRPQPRRRDRELLPRRRGHASGRGHSRRGRQRQGDRGADAGGSGE